LAKPSASVTGLLIPILKKQRGCRCLPCGRSH